MKYRYLIERYGVGVYASTVSADSDAEETGVVGVFGDTDEAKQECETQASRDHEILKWKAAPESWTDALFVSQVLDDGVED